MDSAVAEDPAGPRGRELARRWNAILDQESGGDAEARDRLLNAWHSRGNWPPPMRAWVAGCYMMNEARWERVSRFLENHHIHFEAKVSFEPKAGFAVAPDTEKEKDKDKDKA